MLKDQTFPPKNPFWTLLAFKFIYLVSVLCALLLFPTHRNDDIFQSKRQTWTVDDHLTLESHFSTWDTEHYLYLSEKGYKAGSPTCAFYPLWPLTVRLFASLVKCNHVLVGLLLSNAVSLLGLCLFFRLTKRRFGESVAWLSLTCLLVFPGSLFLQFNYSESLFFTLLMLLCVGLDEDRFWIAVVAAFFLPLTRAVGVLCVVPILATAVISTLSSRGASTIIKGTLIQTITRWLRPTNNESGLPSSKHSILKLSLLALAALFGWSLYLFLMSVWTGNAFEGFEAQKHWGVQSIGNLTDFSKFAFAFVAPTSWHEFVGSALDRFIFYFCICLLPQVWRTDKIWFLWAIVLGVVPAVSGTFCSFTRFASMVFPVFVALGIVLASPKRRFMRYLVLGSFAVLHVVLVWRFVNYRWAG